MSIFKGTPLDVYIHWLILSLGIGILFSGGAVLGSCRSIASFFRLLKENQSFGAKFYRIFYKYHSTYWYVFWCVLAMHLLVTVIHVQLPVAGEPYHLSKQFVFFSSIANFSLVLIVLFSCKSFARVLDIIMSKSALTNRYYRQFYRYHSYFWWLLSISLITHIAFGIYHAMNT